MLSGDGGEAMRTATPFWKQLATLVLRKMEEDGDVICVNKEKAINVLGSRFTKVYQDTAKGGRIVECPECKDNGVST